MKQTLLLTGLLSLFLVWPASATSNRIARIAVDGVVRADENSVRFYIHSKPGEPYDRLMVAEDIRRLHKLGYFDDIRVDRDEGADGMTLTYRFVEKPFVRKTTLQGVDAVEKKQVEARIKTLKGTFFRQDQIPWDKSRIKQYYRSEGYYFTEVSVVVRKLADNYVDVEYTLSEGRKIVISSITFRGARAIAPSELAGVIETDVAGRTGIFGDGAYNKGTLKTDRLRLESFYHDHGYIKVLIGEPEVEIDREKQEVAVTFPVIEGEQYKVGKVEVTGDEIFSTEELAEKIDLEEGDVFDRSRFRQDIFAITELYSQQGYAFANVIPSIVADVDKLVVDVKIRTNKGRRVYIGRINVTGNEETRDRVIRRQFRLSEGEIFNSRLLRRSRQRINGLGFFNQVDIEQRSRREEDLIDLDLKVQERNTGQISFSVGYSSVENIILQGQLQWKNLMGRGQNLSITFDTSSRRSDGSISFTEPGLFDRELSGGFDIFNNSFLYDAYRSRTTGGALRVGRGIGEYTWIRLGYRYERNEVDIRDQTRASFFLREQEGIRTSGSFSPSVSYDSRNDPFNPTAGVNLKLKTEVSGFGGAEHWYQVTGEYAQYQELPANLIGMIHLKAGRADAYADNTLPITKRFFQGGPRSLRGFTYRDIGPLDENGEAIGGEALLQLNAEIQYRFTQFFRGFLFYDRGNVYGSGDRQNNTTEKLYDFGEMRHSWGFGVHFFSPMGPISMAYGFKLDQRTGESPNEFHFTLGGGF